MQSALRQHAFDEVRRLEWQFARAMQAQGQSHQGILCRIRRLSFAPTRIQSCARRFQAVPEIGGACGGVFAQAATP